MMTIKTTFLAALAVAALSTGLAGAAMAQQQRDPAYAAARANGTVGERMNGYLAVVGEGSAELQRMVADLNNSRRRAYTGDTPEGATLEQYAFTAGCIAIWRTEPGEKYQAPDGSWQTRVAGQPPMRDARCPPAPAR